MKRSLVLMIAAVFCGLTTGAIAQSARQIDRHVAEMRKNLHLSGQQAGTIRADMFAASNEKKAIERNLSIPPEVKRMKIREVTKATRDQIGAVLSPRQAAIWRFRMQNRAW
jgi:hypothetical protein